MKTQKNFSQTSSVDSCSTKTTYNLMILRQCEQRANRSTNQSTRRSPSLCPPAVLPARRFPPIAPASLRLVGETFARLLVVLLNSSLRHSSICAHFRTQISFAIKQVTLSFDLCSYIKCGFSEVFDLRISHKTYYRFVLLQVPSWNWV